MRGARKKDNLSAICVEFLTWECMLARAPFNLGESFYHFHDYSTAKKIKYQSNSDILSSLLSTTRDIEQEFSHYLGSI